MRGTLAHLAEVFTDTVKHHDGIVQRVTDNRQNRCQYRQVELDLHQREYAQGDNHIVYQGGYCAHRKAVFETQRDIDQDTDQRIQHGETALLCQFLTHLRTDELHTSHLHRRICIPQCGKHLLAEFGAGAVCAWRNTDQHIARSTKMLHLRIAKTDFFQNIADTAKTGGFRVGDLDQRATGKIYAEAQAFGKQESERTNDENRRQDDGILALAHEIDLEVFTENMHVLDSAYTGNRCKRRPP